jgi:hypothetical protein
MEEKVVMLAEALVALANYFNGANVKFDVSKMPSLAWAQGFSTAVSAVIPGLDYISKNDGIFKGSGEEKLDKGVNAIASSIVKASQLLAKGNWSVMIPAKFITELDKNLKMYIDLTRYLNQSDVNYEDLTNYADSMVKLANAYEKLGDALVKLKGDLDGMDMTKMKTLKNLTGGIVLLSTFEPTHFDAMMLKLEERAKIFLDLMGETVTQEDNPPPPKASEIQNLLGAGKAGPGGGVKTPEKEMKVEEALAKFDEHFQDMRRSLDAIAVVVAGNGNISLAKALQQYLSGTTDKDLQGILEGGLKG